MCGLSVDHRIFTRIDVDESFKCRTEYRILKYEHVKKYTLMGEELKLQRTDCFIQHLVIHASWSQYPRSFCSGHAILRPSVINERRV